MRYLLIVPLLAIACGFGGPDNDWPARGRSGPHGLPGIDPARWEMETDSPGSGTHIDTEAIFAGLDGGRDGVLGHFTQIHRNARSNRVLCAATWIFHSDGNSFAEGDCDAVWEVSWEPPDGHDSPFCERTLGVDLLTVDFGAYELVGYQMDPANVCVAKRGQRMEVALPDYQWVEYDSDRFVMIAEWDDRVPDR